MRAAHEHSRRVAAFFCAAASAVACGSESPSPALSSDSGTTPGADTGQTGSDSALGSSDSRASSEGGPDTGPLVESAIYAAPNGSGTSCTQKAPCSLTGAATAVQAVNANMTADVVVYLRGGTYQLASAFALGPRDSGSNGHQIVYQAFPAEVPVLSGAAKATGFAQVDATLGIWRAALPAGVSGRQMFVNGVRAQRARSIGAPPGVAATAAGFTTSDGSYASYKNQTNVEIIDDRDWKHMRCPLQTITPSGGGSSFNVLPSCWTANHTSVPNLGFPFNGAGLPTMSEITWVENAYELLKQPGQFYADLAASQLFYIPRPGEDLTTADVELPALETLVNLAGMPGHLASVNDADAGASVAVSSVHDITFKGITFSYATWKLPGVRGYIDNQAGVLWDTTGPTATPMRIPAAVQVHRGSNISFISDVFSHLGGTGVDLADGTQKSSVIGSIIDDTSGGGISVGEVDDYSLADTTLMTSGDTIADNTISNVGKDYHDAVGIWAGYTRNLTIQRNDIGHTSYSGMSLGWGWGFASPCALQAKQGLATCRHGTIYAGGNQILDNYIHDVMGSLHDGGPIYTNGGQGNGDGSATSVLAKNFVTAGNHTNNMLYHDEGSSYWNTHDNVTSFGGDTWMGMWTPTIHDITIGPVNYTDNAKTNNNGTSITLTAPTVVAGGNWPQAALAIMTSAGPAAAYRVPNPVRDDDDQEWSYAGTWMAVGTRGYGDFEDNVHATQTNGDSVTVTFTGTGISWIGEKSQDQGQMEWLIDGQSKGTVDTSLPTGRKTQQVLFTSEVLPLASHTLKVVKRSGTYMTADAAQITVK